MANPAAGRECLTSYADALDTPEIVMFGPGQADVHLNAAARALFADTADISAFQAHLDRHVRHLQILPHEKLTLAYHDRIFQITGLASSPRPYPLRITAPLGHAVSDLHLLALYELAFWNQWRLDGSDPSQTATAETGPDRQVNTGDREIGGDPTSRLAHNLTGVGVAPALSHEHTGPGPDGWASLRDRIVRSIHWAIPGIDPLSRCSDLNAYLSDHIHSLLIDSGLSDSVVHLELVPIAPEPAILKGLLRNALVTAFSHFLISGYRSMHISVSTVAGGDGRVRLQIRPIMVCCGRSPAPPPKAPDMHEPQTKGSRPGGVTELAAVLRPLGHRLYCQTADGLPEIVLDLAGVPAAPRHSRDERQQPPVNGDLPQPPLVTTPLSRGTYVDLIRTPQIDGAHGLLCMVQRHEHVLLAIGAASGYCLRSEWMQQLIAETFATAASLGEPITAIERIIDHRLHTIQGTASPDHATLILADIDISNGTVAIISRGRAAGVRIGTDDHVQPLPVRVGSPFSGTGAADIPVWVTHLDEGEVLLLGDAPDPGANACMPCRSSIPTRHDSAAPAEQDQASPLLRTAAPTPQAAAGDLTETEPAAGPLVRVALRPPPTGRLIVASDFGAISPIVDRVVDACKQTSFSPQQWYEIKLALHEALVNAINHGNRQDPRLPVIVCYRSDTDRIEITVSDQGPGFDPSTIPDPTSPDQIWREGGRGLFLIRTMMDSVEHSDGGSSITITKLLRRNDKQ